jgi:hypothetical protein
MPLPPAAVQRPASMAGIDGLETENVAEKCAVRFGVLAVDNYMSARNHLPLHRNTRNS